MYEWLLFPYSHFKKIGRNKISTLPQKLTRLRKLEALFVLLSSPLLSSPLLSSPLLSSPLLSSPLLSSPLLSSSLLLSSPASSQGLTLKIHENEFTTLPVDILLHFQFKQLSVCRMKIKGWKGEGEGEKREKKKDRRGRGELEDEGRGSEMREGSKENFYSSGLGKQNN
jgi:hypothetical protein